MDPSRLAYATDYYSQVYPDYDRQNPPAKLAHYLASLQRFAPPLSDCENWLDYGCAHGKFLTFVDQSTHPKAIFGMDVNTAALDEARQRLSAGTFLEATLDNLALLPALDVVTVLDVLEHVPELELTLAALCRQLKPSGRLMVVVPVYDGPLGPVITMLDKDPTHIHKCSRYFWLDLVSKYFDLVHWHGILRYLLPTGHYLHFPTCLGRSIATAVLMIAKRKA